MRWAAPTQRFCRTLERAGLRREPWEGPQHFGDARRGVPQAHAAAIRQITDLYIQLRYGRRPGPAKPLLDAVHHLPRFQPPSRR